MKHYYKVHFKPQNGLVFKELDFGKCVKDVGIRDGSYILYDKSQKVISIIPFDSVLYIQRIEEEE